MHHKGSRWWILTRIVRRLYLSKRNLLDLKLNQILIPEGKIILEKRRHRILLNIGVISAILLCVTLMIIMFISVSSSESLNTFILDNLMPFLVIGSVLFAVFITSNFIRNRRYKVEFRIETYIYRTYSRIYLRKNPSVFFE